MILDLCKGVHCVDLGESFQTHIFLQILASIQPRTSPVKFATSPYAALAAVQLELALSAIAAAAEEVSTSLST